MVSVIYQSNSDFAFETTLVTKSYVNTIKKAQAKGYFVTLIYFWLNSPELAVERVKERVQMGGHNIPNEIIYRRYSKGISNFAKLYMPNCDFWMIIDNSNSPFCVIAEGNKTENIVISNQEIFNQIIHL